MKRRGSWQAAFWAASEAGEATAEVEGALEVSSGLENGRVLMVTSEGAFGAAMAIGAARSRSPISRREIIAGSVMLDMSLRMDFWCRIVDEIDSDVWSQSVKYEEAFKII